eukprot:1161783-Pelagomonas_calceolata.AAC.2
MTCMHNVHIEGLHQRVWRLSRRLAGAVGILAALSLQSLPQINELHAAGSLRFTSWKRTARRLGGAPRILATPACPASDPRPTCKRLVVFYNTKGLRSGDDRGHSLFPQFSIQSFKEKKELSKPGPVACRITHPVHAIGLVLPPYVCAPPRVSAEATPII